MNNPAMQLAALLRSGGNPMQMMQQMAARDPRAALAMKMTQGKNATQLQQLAMNMAQERGVDINQLISQLGFKSK